MTFEGIKRINIIGSPELPVPAGMTVESVAAAMKIDLSTYDKRVEGDTLVLSAAAGSKGIVDVRLVDGKVLPRGGKSFPTDADIDHIAILFPEDNLFETLESVEKLQEYAQALAERGEELIEKLVAEQQTERAAQIAQAITDVKAVVGQVAPYALKVENPVSGNIVAALEGTRDQLEGLLAIAEEFEVAARKQADEDAELERLLEIVRAEASEAEEA